jgi:CRP-like cAMP-binding protein
MPAAIVNVLDEDPELAEPLGPERLALARPAVRAATIRLWPGPWTVEGWPDRVRRGLGLLVLDGLLVRRVELDGRFGGELLAGGDMLRPWQSEDALASIPRNCAWRVLRRSRMAVLDLDFAKQLTAYPEIHGQLLSRALRRSRYLAVNMAIAHQPKVETRLQMLFWHLADRWGTVRGDGVLVPVELTHAVLSELVAASRPVVSAALGTLHRNGQIRRTHGGWLLEALPSGDVHGLAAIAASARLRRPGTRRGLRTNASGA